MRRRGEGREREIGFLQKDETDDVEQKPLLLLPLLLSPLLPLLLLLLDALSNGRCLLLAGDK